MSKRRTGVGKKLPSRSKKTAKRRAAKATMLAEKKAKAHAKRMKAFKK
ncbi:MAG: hypothetical protein R3B52_00855 [Candidatus Paceibacterota bacterium]